MKLEAEGRPDIFEPLESQVVKVVNSLRSYGPTSYASLTDANGNYVQVAGGGVTCIIERYIAEDRRRFRAFHDKPSDIRPDGTILAFRAGNIPMRADEWFMSNQVVEVFVAFLNGKEFPAYVHWRSAPGF